jgi:hypothetical protein
MIEVYTKIPGDVDYNEDQLEISNEFDAYLQQIKNVFSPEPGSIMGAEDMAIDLERYIYEMNLSGDRLQKKIRDVIFTYCTFSQIFRTKVSVKFAKGVKRDLAFIDIIVEDDKGSSKKINVFIK